MWNCWRNHWQTVRQRERKFLRDRTGRSATESFGQSKVRHARLVARVDEQFGRLQIAMQNAAFMRVVDGFGDGLHPARHASICVLIGSSRREEAQDT